MHIDNSNGLPQNSVLSIGKDEQGYMWLATESGLVRYDGVNFEIRYNDSLRLRTSRFYHLAPDGRGGLLAVNKENELIRISHSKLYTDTTRDQYHANFVKWQHPSYKWDSGITRYMGLPHRASTWNGRLTEFSWNAGVNGRYHYEKGVLEFSGQGQAVYKHVFDSDGSWNFFLLDDALFFLHKSGKVTLFGPGLHTSPLKGDITKAPGFPKGAADIKVFWTPFHRSYILLYFNEEFYLAYRNGNGLTTKRIFSAFNADAADIVCAFYDPGQRRLYLGSSTKGLFVLIEQPFKAIQAPVGKNSQYSQAPFGPDGVLVPAGYVFRLSGATCLGPSLKQTADLDAYSISIDGSGAVWTKGNRHLYHFSGNRLNLLQSWELPAKVTMISHDEGDTLWVGVAGKQGVWLIDERHPEHGPAPLMKLTEDVTCFARAGKRFMYIGTDNRLYRFDCYTRKLDTIPAFDGMYIRSVTSMGAGEIWVSTYDNGFFLYQENRVTTFPLDNDKYLRTAHCIMPDQRGYLWITTNRGLFQVKRDDLLKYAKDTTAPLYYHYYDKDAGFATNEFNGGCQPCAVQLKNGYISLPSMNGLVFFHPDSVHPILATNRVQIDQILLDKVQCKTDTSILLPRRFNSLQVFFSVPYMGNIKNLHIQYALVRAGAGDTSWLPFPGNGPITFSTIPSGTFHLIVRKLNGFGTHNYSDTVLELLVEHAWYEVRYFYLLILLFMLLIAVLFSRLRAIYAKRKNIALQALVDVKTHELKHQYDIHERVIQSVSHNILTPLEYQMLLSQNIFDKVAKESPAVAPVARVMNDNARQLYHITANLLKYLKGRMTTGLALSNAFHPAESADEILKIFSAIASEKNTHLINSIPQELVIFGDSQLVSVILHNLIDNAVKVTRNGSITISATADGQKTAIIVSDTGPGLPGEIEEWFNGPGLRRYSLSSGIGLLIVKELSQEMGLRTCVTANLPRGSIFKMVFATQVS